MKLKYSFLLMVFVITEIFVFIGCKTDPNALYKDTNGEIPDGFFKVIFFAYGRGTLVEGKKSIGGHAFVSIDGLNMWGFYPSVLGKLVTKHGELKVENFDCEANRFISMEKAEFFVDQGIKDQILNLIAEWENNPPRFTVMVNDCVSFIYRVCDIIGLSYNHLALRPTSAVKTIRNKNKEYRIYFSRKE